MPALPAGQAEASAPPPATDDAPRWQFSDLLLHNAPPWLVSSLLHMVLLIALGLWLLPAQVERIFSLELLGPDSTELGDQLLSDDPLRITTDEPLGEDTVLTPLELQETNDPFAAPPDLDLALSGGTTASSPIVAPEIGMALNGRTEGTKQQLLSRYGGTGKTEGAVDAGLAWLAKQQRPDGSWSLKGPYADGGGFENTAAATAMALLAFQGAGQTHQQGRYRVQVDKGSRFLLSLQDNQGNFFHNGPFNNAFYTQAQCTIALCELLGMTGDYRLKDPAQNAVRYLLICQDPSQGGWRYRPQMESDTSVTGWVVMALESARMASLDVPRQNFESVGRYLDLASHDEGSRYGYLPGDNPTPTMTAEALLCRQYLGWSKDDQRLNAGVNWLVKDDNLPSWRERNVYYWYYAAQVLHHLGDERWDKFNNIVRELLPSKQEKKGSEAGSWHPMAGDPDRWGVQGGRLYVTCLSLYILEVYYRHMPLYASR